MTVYHAGIYHGVQLAVQYSIAFISSSHPRLLPEKILDMGSDWVGDGGKGRDRMGRRNDRKMMAREREREDVMGRCQGTGR